VGSKLTNGDKDTEVQECPYMKARFIEYACNTPGETFTQHKAA